MGIDYDVNNVINVQARQAGKSADMIELIKEQIIKSKSDTFVNVIDQCLDGKAKIKDYKRFKKLYDPNFENREYIEFDGNIVGYIEIEVMTDHCRVSFIPTKTTIK